MVIVLTEWLPNTIRKRFPKSGQRFLDRLGEIFAIATIFMFVAILVALLARPWIAPEKFIEDKIVDFIPGEVRSG
jgi:hypothetical protein